MLLLYADRGYATIAMELFKNISCYYYINELIKSKALKSKFKNISCYYYIFANLIFMC